MTAPPSLGHGRGVEEQVAVLADVRARLAAADRVVRAAEGALAHQPPPTTAFRFGDSTGDSSPSLDEIEAQLADVYKALPGGAGGSTSGTAASEGEEDAAERESLLERDPVAYLRTSEAHRTTRATPEEDADHLATIAEQLDKVRAQIGPAAARHPSASASADDALPLSIDAMRRGLTSLSKDLELEQIEAELSREFGV